MRISPSGRIPTLVGMAVLSASLFIGIFLTQQTRVFVGKASQDCQPINIQVTNLTSSSVDLSFVTAKDCQVTVNINNQIYSSINNNQAKGKTHYFQIDGLKADSHYTYFFLAEGKQFSNSDYQITTFSPSKQEGSQASLAWGRVFIAESQPAVGSIIYLNTPGFYPLSSFVTNQGYWNIPLTNSYSLESKKWSPPQIDSVDEITILSPDGQMLVLVNDTGQKNPVPDIFINSQAFSQTTGQNDFVQTSSSRQGSIDLIIDNPADGEVIYDLQPNFFGQGPAGALVEIELNSDTKITDSFSVNDDGSWQWSTPAGLEPGEHTIKLRYTDPISGVIQTVTRKFTVLASSDNLGPAFTASGSATNPSPTITSHPTPQPTLKPTATVFPTSIPTLAPPTPTPTLVVTGGVIPTISIISVAIFLTIFSVILLSY